MAAFTTVEHVVVDAGGFIRQAPIKEIGEEVYSVPQVVKEITDKGTKQRLQVLPYTLNLKNPTPEAVIFVSDFAKKTGDYRNLSQTDISVLALTYMLEKQHVGDKNIKEPSKKLAEYIIPSKGNSGQQIAGFYQQAETKSEGKENSDEENSESSKNEMGAEAESSDMLPEDLIEEEEEAAEKEEAAKSGGDQPEDLEEEDEEAEIEEAEEDDDDDDEGWITPSNINNIKSQMGMGSPMTEKTRVTVACLTTDFAMQNVLIQMGLNVVSVDGMLIKQARSYVLRCFTCTKITYDTTKVFCPNCGNKTLKRVAMMMDEDGKVHYYFSKRPLNIRGTKFSLPTPKGGKYSNNPYLCEDQPMPQQRARKSKQVDVLDPDYIAGSSPFAFNDVTSRAATIGLSGKHDFRSGAYWNRRNPNEARKPKKRR